MKLWIDDVRPAPEGFFWIKTVNGFIDYMEVPVPREIELISIDHDAGKFAVFGGDYIKILDWLEEHNKSYPIHIHSMNPVGRYNMRKIIEKNHWKEIYL